MIGGDQGVYKSKCNGGHRSIYALYATCLSDIVNLSAPYIMLFGFW